MTVWHSLMTKMSYIQIIQRFQNNILRYIRTDKLYGDLKVDLVASFVSKYAEGHERILYHHINV